MSESAALRRRISSSRPRTVRLRTLLYVNTTLCAIIAFSACRVIISSLHSGVFCALFLAAIAVDALKLRRPPRFALNIVSVGILVTAFMTLRYNVVIETFTGAVLLLIAVKMLEEKQSRDYIQILGLSVLALLSAAVLSADETVLYYCFLMSVIAGYELMLITWFGREPEAELTSGAMLRTLGASLAIWLTMAPICLALFLMAPRARTAMVRFQPADQRRTFSGFSEQITLGSIRDIQISEEIAFRAETELLPPNMLYWRGLILEIFDGRTWTPARRNPNQGTFSAGGHRVSQRILLEPGNHQILFALDKPIVMQGDNVVQLDDAVFARMNPRNAARIEYTVTSALSPSMKPSNPSANSRRRLNLPPNYSARLRETVRELSRGRSGREIIDAVSNFLAQPEYEYTIDSMQVSQNPIEDFIFSTKRGNCEFFASAMAVMLRMAGIQTRLVAGYLGGQYNESGGYYIVRQSDAHVWVEVWDEKSGEWVRRDPTPGAAADASSQGGFNFLSPYIDMINYHMSRIFLLYDRESQSEILSLVRSLLSNPGEALAQNAGALISLARTAAVVLLCAALLGALYVALKKIRLRRYSRDDVLLRDFLRVMKRRGFEKKICDGLEEFAASIPRVHLKGRGAGGLAELARTFVLRFEMFYF
ncbi:MAG: transglutaminaseTgpA domain-containing protein, partial [Synergistaceae bacterium]|nr:transglutaminaseTgpA domain-containing protein [Synergistaceae bacterium]